MNKRSNQKRKSSKPVTLKRILPKLNFKYVRELVVLVFFILGVSLFYGNTLQNGFIHDDHGLIETNTYIQSFKYLPKVITSCVWESANGTCKNSVNYHPIESLSYILTFMISPQPWFFHLINLIYFVITIFLVFILVRFLTNNFMVAFFSAFITMIHPVNTEVVNWIAAGLSMIITIFALLATICYIQYRRKKDLKYLSLTYIFYALGVFSKESVVLIPLVFITLDLIFFRQKIFFLLKWKNLRPYIVMGVIFLIYMILRFLVLGNFMANSAYSQIHNLTISQYIYVFIDLFAKYIKELFWPFPLSYFHTFNPSYQFFSLHFLINFFLVFIFIGACFLAWKRKLPVILFALIWFFVFLFPSLAFINSLGDNKFAERHIFTSLIGFSIIAAIILEWFRKNFKQGKKIVYGFLLIVSILAFIYIYNHNLIWKNDISLDLNTLKTNPDADLIRYNLALEYLTEKNPELAKEQLIQLIENNNWYNLFRVYYTLGGIYRLEGNYDEATNNYQASIAKNPTYKDTYNNIGAMSLENRKYIDSVLYLCKAIQLDPNFTNANNNFNIAASTIQSLDNKTFMLLYDQILHGDIFKPNNSPVTLKNKDCSYSEGCLLTFSSDVPVHEFLFPFLTVGITDSNEVVRTRYFNFDPKTSDITIGIDHQFGNSKTHFWFPTCNNSYYGAETK